jgi:hypothetical protein
MNAETWKKLYILDDGEQTHFVAVNPDDKQLEDKLLTEPPKNYFALAREHKFTPDSQSLYTVKTPETVFNNVVIERSPRGYFFRAGGLALLLANEDYIKKSN